MRVKFGAYALFCALFTVMLSASSAHAGRFMTMDPAGWVNGPNTYGFCGGDPVNRWDPMGLDYLEFGNRNDATSDRHILYWVVTDGPGFNGNVLHRIPIGRQATIGSGRITIHEPVGGDFIPDDEGFNQLYDAVRWDDITTNAMKGGDATARLNAIEGALQRFLGAHHVARLVRLIARQAEIITNIDDKDAGRWLGAVREQERQGKWYAYPNAMAFSMASTLSFGGAYEEDVENLGQYDQGKITGGQRALRTVFNTGRSAIGGAASVVGLKGQYEVMGLKLGANLEANALRTGVPLPFSSTGEYANILRLMQRVEAGGGNPNAILQTFACRANEALAANPALAQTVLSRGEYAVGQQIPGLANAFYGRGVERIVAANLRQSDFKGWFSYAGSVPGPDFIGRGPLQGMTFDVHTPLGLSSHLARGYSNLNSAIYDRPTNFVTLP